MSSAVLSRPSRHSVPNGCEHPAGHLAAIQRLSETAPCGESQLPLGSGTSQFVTWKIKVKKMKAEIENGLSRATQMTEVGMWYVGWNSKKGLPRSGDWMTPIVNL